MTRPPPGPPVLDAEPALELRGEDALGQADELVVFPPSAWESVAIRSLANRALQGDAPCYGRGVHGSWPFSSLAVRGADIAARDGRFVLVVWVAWLLAVLALLAISGAVDLPPLHPHMASLKHGGHGPLWVLQGWDFRWYRGIANDGYGFGGIASYAFFPLWPAVLRAYGRVGVQVPLALVTAALLSAVAFVVVAASNPVGARRRTAVALASLPGSFALLLPYADVLALAAAASAYLAAKHARWRIAVLLGFAAAVARPNAFLLSILLAGVAWNARDRLRWVAAAAPIAGFLVVNCTFWIVSGDALAFLHAERHWGRGSPLDLGLPSRWNEIQPFVAAAAVVLAAGLWRRRRTYGTAAPLFAASVIALSLLSGTFDAFSRQMLLAFPLAWAAADIPRTLARIAAAVGIAGGAATILFLPQVFP